MSQRMTGALLAVSLAVSLAALSSAGAQGATKFTLTSPDVHAGQKLASAQVFSGMGCTGSNMSPALEWHGAPATTKSYAITLYDPDAPTGSGWWHWVVYNIPASTTKLAAGAGDARVKCTELTGLVCWGGTFRNCRHYVYTLKAARL